MNFEEYKIKTEDYYLDKATFYQQKYDFKITPGTIGHNDETDAFRHAFMQGSFTWKARLAGKTASYDIVKYIGDDHEKNPDNPTLEKNMDLWNNEVGRKTAISLERKLGPKYYTMSQNEFEDLLAAEIVKQMRNEKLVTNLSDRRKFKDSQSNPYKNQNDNDKQQTQPLQTKGFLNEIEELKNFNPYGNVVVAYDTHPSNYYNQTIKYGRVEENTYGGSTPSFNSEVKKADPYSDINLNNPRYAGCTWIQDLQEQRNIAVSYGFGVDISPNGRSFFDDSSSKTLLNRLDYLHNTEDKSLNTGTSNAIIPNQNINTSSSPTFVNNSFEAASSTSSNTSNVINIFSKKAKLLAA